MGDNFAPLNLLGYIMQNTRPTLPLHKLPSFSKWANSFGKDHGLTLMDYLAAKGSTDLAIAFSQIFWPEVIKVNGCYLRVQSLHNWADPIPAGMKKEERQNMESLINHLHVYDLFTYEDENIELEVDEYLGLIIRSCWAASLKYQIPNINFKVEYWSEPIEYGPTITFWQI